MAEMMDDDTSRSSGSDTSVPMTQKTYDCILQCSNPCFASDSLDNITTDKWDSMQAKSMEWKGLDKFGDVYCSVDWEKGPNGLHMHNTCYTSLSSNRKLLQAKQRQRKSEQSLQEVAEVADTNNDPTLQASAPKKLRSNMGCLHDKHYCVWCMKGANNKRNYRDQQLILLSTVDAWNKFKLHIVRLEDKAMRERLDTLTYSIPDAQTAFGIEIRYHRQCWRKYISDQKPLTDEIAQHLQRVTLREAQVLFFQHVREVIFQDHELRTLQGLLKDYTRIISNYGHDSIVKSSYLKDILTKEFGESIGFHQRDQKNVSELVYDTTAGGTYIEAAISSLGVTDDQLTLNIASRLNVKVTGTSTVPWPPYMHELEKEENLSELLMKLITWMKNPNMSAVDDSATVRSIASLLTSDITGKRTAFRSNISVMVHGLTKSREIIDIMHKDGLGISYNDVLMLRDFWVVNDLKHSLNCPFELAEGKPTIAVVDNDDFKTDTLTGAGQPHRTNVMFVQPESFDNHSSESTKDRPVPSATLASTLSASLKELGSQMQQITPYKTVKRGEPPVRKEPDRNEDNTSDTCAQRTRSVIHALARAQPDKARPKPEDQTVPGFSGFHAKMSQPVEKSRAIYHITYPDPPSKTILYDVMSNLAKSINEKKMPFAIIVGDHPVYVLMLSLKSENPTQFGKILPFMGPFHIEMSFIYAIYKRFKGSGIADMLVAASVIAEGSVDQRLCGKHFKRGVCCLRLLYETLIHHALDKRLDGAPLSEELKIPLPNSGKLMHRNSQMHTLS